MQDPYARREAVQTLNRDAIQRLLSKHKLILNARELPLWRPLKPHTGSVPGVWECVSIVATNGILAWFEHPDGVLRVGHLSHFDGKAEPLYSSSLLGSVHGGRDGTTPYKGPRKPRTVSPAKMTVAQMRKKMLEDL